MSSSWVSVPDNGGGSPRSRQPASSGAASRSAAGTSNRKRLRGIRSPYLSTCGRGGFEQSEKPGEGFRQTRKATPHPARFRSAQFSPSSSVTGEGFFGTLKLSIAGNVSPLEFCPPKIQL